MSSAASPSGKAIAAVVCYNNGASAARTLAAMPPAEERDFDVVVVDDGSTDDTAEQIAAFDFPIIRHEHNRGLGAAIKSGMRHALDHHYDIFCILAGNDKDDPREIPKLLAPIRAGEADYVQGSRFCGGGRAVNTPWFRYVMVKVHAKVMGLCTGFWGTDSLNGFRAYRTALLRPGRGEDGRENPINVWQDWLDGYELETYLHFSVLRSGRRVREVGVSKTYPAKARRRRYSHIRPGRDWWRILRPIPLLMLGLRK